MALLLSEGFDYINQTILLSSASKWSVNYSTAFPNINASAGRYGSGAFFMSGASAWHFIYYVFPATQQTVVAGCAFKHGNGATNVVTVFAFRDVDTIQVDVRKNTNNTLSITRNGTVLGTTSATFDFTVYQYIELKATIGASGSYELRVNGTNVLSASGVNTQATGNAYVTNVGFGTFSFTAGGHVLYWDDVYLLNTAGSVNNDFLGDTRIVTQLPLTDEGTPDWTKSGGASNASCVDESPHNSDTDYVSSNTLDHKDLYNYPALPATVGIIRAVVINPVGRKTEAGANRYLKGACKSGASEVDSTTPQLMYDTYTFKVQHIFETNPDGGGAWSRTSVDAAPCGMKLTEA